ncbi:cytochrome P450 [Streptomyces albireticuli]|uniref:Hydroxylase n=1 Tax=Streptomyces albireticuli TaxID=1940 RepID=A0A2A2DCR3_9ACTN|nr:cytochrome P450 [Streptomyces albireticuli]MCD9141028.1 cytochrome P450 [Streptomyces albireticuli]MCD9161010.1 cytochrome P450 [Streptomyces albireticuli]MCD9190932.1 cytochrome P450 [Streptomyces albireticuli]PAU49236.1 hydroxylase [Streptomyces albireticuli]
MSTAVTDPGVAMTTLMTPEGKRDPYPLYEALRAYGPLLRLGPDQLVVTGHAECFRALREPRLLSTDGPVQDRMMPGWRDHSSWVWLAQNMLFSNSPDHERYRRFFSGAFTPRRIAETRPVVEGLIDGLIDRLAGLGADGAPVDFMAEFAFRVPMAVMGALLGIPEEDQAAFRGPVGDITTALEPIRDLSQLDRGDAGMEWMAAYFTELAAARRAEPRDDLVSAMTRARDESGELSEEELIANFMLLLVAGTEAPMDLIGNALRLAFDHPGHADALREDPGLAPGYIEETLRFDPAAQALNRVAATDMEFFGVPLTEGTKVTLLIAAGNRDPRRFPDPLRFDPYRTGNHALTFSGGAHFCLGAALARMQAETALPRLLRRFPGLRPAGEPTFRDQLVQRGFDRLPVKCG